MFDQTKDFSMNPELVIQHLKSLAEPGYTVKMSHFGIDSGQALGIRMPVLRTYAKTLKPNQELAEELWAVPLHEAKLMAILLLDKKKLSAALMERWAPGFYSWDLVDQFCIAFAKTPWAMEKAMGWSHEEGEFIKRAGFALMVTICMHDKKRPDDDLLPFFARMEAEAHDGRNFVKKAINWALRTLGKRNLYLHPYAIACAERIRAQGSPSAKWIASDALRELKSEKIMDRLRKKTGLKTDKS